MNQKTSKVEKEFYLRCSYLTLSVLFDKEPKRKKHNVFAGTLFDAESGKYIRLLGGQGYNENSCWSRGNAWALYGLYYPSGNVIPSQQDMNFTKRIQKCGEMMGITVLDHLIIGRKRYFSLREEGMMEEK
ncbi:hypothetical protein EfmAA242_23320 [Enterococcus faecium]|nr:hypothetical protein EfmAA242_23320 [Enterococcus faecium]